MMSEYDRLRQAIPAVYDGAASDDVTACMAIGFMGATYANRDDIAASLSEFYRIDISADDVARLLVELHRRQQSH